MATNSTTTHAETRCSSEPSEQMPRALRNSPKYRRFDAVAREIVAALPDTWEATYWSVYWLVVLRCPQRGIEFGLRIWPGRKWGYRLDPLRPRGPAVGYCRWPDETAHPHPGFALHTPPDEVAAYIRDTFVPDYLAEIDRALERRRHAELIAERREAARALQREAATRIRDARSEVDDAWIPLSFSVPSRDAVACARELSQALRGYLARTANTPSVAGGQ
ncbi:hypothetical protein [Amycolatopsis sp. 195334CR]|uniref:hypothetical protein n=1 Tax=Amycolatopsis sp. 195334CR TaxID=2814588 RepID=UPI001A8E37CE|nr:hypothetical protein [Amycolatopsis sp. 195334CR]MBN6034144.1 hypothetical protein [Amycolatopsis sp. 195334CR]